MIPATAPFAQPQPDWRQSLRDAITDAHELLEALDLGALADRLPARDAGFAVRVPRGFVARMRRGDPHDPLLLQVLPQLAECEDTPGFTGDAVGDLAAATASAGTFPTRKKSPRRMAGAKRWRMSAPIPASMR